MSSSPIRSLVPRLRELVSPRAGAPADRELLHRFAAERDEDAFAEVVRRHGPMALRVCRRVLGGAPDAEDVCQAAFVLLARKAASAGWHDSVAGWLYQTVHRLALKARVAAARRARREARARPPQQADASAELTARELLAVLDEELSRLPEKYRAAIVLCCLEGRSRDEAASCLGWSLATVKDRLKEGRQRLRGRLARRGIDLGAALASAWLVEEAAHQALEPHAIARAALLAALAPGGARTALWCGIALLAGGLALALAAARGPTRHVEEPAGRPAAVTRMPAEPARLPLIGHKGAVRAVAFAADGKTLVTSGMDKTIRIWDVATGAEKYRRTRAWDAEGRPTDQMDRTAVVVGLACSPDGKTFAAHSTGKFGWFSLWDAIRVEELSSAGANPYRRREEGGAVAYSPDGKMIVAGYGGGFTVVYDNRRAGYEFCRIRGPIGRASVAISPDSKRLAVAGGGAIQLVELPTGRVLHNPLGLPGTQAVTALAFLARGTRVVAADGGKGLRVLDTSTGKEARAFSGSEAVRALATSAGGKRLATAGVGGTVVLWDDSGKEERRFFTWEKVDTVAFSPDGKRLATAGDGGVVLWDLTRAEKPLPADLHLSARELSALWADLLSSEGNKAHAAARRLRADPARSLPFLHKHLAGRVGPDEKRLRQLIADLDAEEFARRDAATKELEKRGREAEWALRAALGAGASLEARLRLEKLLGRLGKERLTAQQRRDVHAVRVLEQVGTPQARLLLEGLSKAAPGWWAIREAKDALQRLRREKKP